MSFATIGGVRIAYEEAGSGKPIVFIHEFAGSTESWVPQMAHFAARYHTVAYNAIGYPPSDVPSDVALYEQDRQVAYLYGLLAHLGLAHAHIVGLSMGSHTAIGFALAHPAMVRSLVLAGAGTGSTNVPAFRDDALRRAALLREQGMQGLDSYLRGTTRARFLQRDPAGWQRFADLFMAHSAEGSANTLEGFQARRPSLYTIEDALRGLDVPTLVVTGDEDDPCVEPSVYLKRTLPRSGLEVMAQSGHAVNIERPAEFNAALDGFFADVEAGGWPRFDPGSGDSWRL